MKIAPQWDEHSVPFCAQTCPAFGSCAYEIGYGPVCVPAVRAMATLLAGDFASRYLRNAVAAEYERIEERKP